jgi:hypothetical protein
MRHLSLLLMLLAASLFSCQSRIVPSGPWVKKIDSEALSSIVINFSTKMKIEKHLELEDSWAGYNDYINRICLKYSSQRLLTVYDARLLLVELVEEFLDRLNNHTLVSFELAHYPFTADDLDVRISFESYYGRYIDPLYIGLVWLQGGCAHFYAFDIKDNYTYLNGIDWNHYRFEPYTKSRELALIKRQADLPYIEHIEHIENPSAPRRRNGLYEANTPYISPF